MMFEPIIGMDPMEEIQAAREATAATATANAASMNGNGMHSYTTASSTSSSVEIHSSSISKPTVVLSKQQIRDLKRNPKKYLEYLSEQNRLKTATLAASSYATQKTMLELNPLELWKAQREKGWIEIAEPVKAAPPVTKPPSVSPEHSPTRTPERHRRSVSHSTSPGSLSLTRSSSVSSEKPRGRGRGSSLQLERNGSAMKSTIFPAHPEFSQETKTKDSNASNYASNSDVAAAASSSSSSSTNTAAPPASIRSASIDRHMHIQHRHRPRRSLSASRQPVQSSDELSLSPTGTFSPTSPNNPASRIRKSWVQPTHSQLAEMKRLMEEAYALNQLEEQMIINQNDGQIPISGFQTHRAWERDHMEAINSMEETKEQNETYSYDINEEDDATPAVQQQPHSIFSSTQLSAALDSSLTHRGPPLTHPSSHASLPSDDYDAASASDTDDVNISDRSGGRTNRRRKTWTRGQVWITTKNGESVVLSPDQSRKMAAANTEQSEKEEEEEEDSYAAANAMSSSAATSSTSGVMDFSVAEAQSVPISAVSSSSSYSSSTDNDDHAGLQTHRGARPTYPSATTTAASATNPHRSGFLSFEDAMAAADGVQLPSPPSPTHSPPLSARSAAPPTRAPPSRPPPAAPGSSSSPSSSSPSSTPPSRSPPARPPPSIPPTSPASRTFSPSGSQTSRRPARDDPSLSEYAIPRAVLIDQPYDTELDWSDPLADEAKRDMGDGTGEEGDKRYKLIFVDGDFGRYSTFYSTRSELNTAKYKVQAQIDAAVEKALADDRAARGGSASSSDSRAHAAHIHPHSSRRPAESGRIKRWERPVWASDLPVRGRVSPLHAAPPTLPPTPRSHRADQLPPSLPETPRTARSDDGSDSDVHVTIPPPDLPPTPPDGFETPRSYRGGTQAQAQSQAHVAAPITHAHHHSTTAVAVASSSVTSEQCVIA